MDGMKGRMKRVATAWVVVALAVVVLCGCGGGEKAAPHAVAPEIEGPLLPSLAGVPAETESAVELGRYAPDFTLPDMNGKSATLSDWRGKPVLLNFWASWCAPCRQEMPLLQATHEAYADDGLVVLSINMHEKGGGTRASSRTWDWPSPCSWTKGQMWLRSTACAARRRPTSLTATASFASGT